MGALIVLAMMMALNGHHPPPHYLPPKHDTCCGYKGCDRHNHFSGRACGIPWIDRK